VTVETRAKSVTVVRMVCVAPNSNVATNAVVPDTVGTIMSYNVKVAPLSTFLAFTNISMAITSIK